MNLNCLLIPNTSGIHLCMCTHTHTPFVFLLPGHLSIISFRKFPSHFSGNSILPLLCNSERKHRQRKVSTSSREENQSQNDTLYSYFLLPRVILYISRKSTIQKVPSLLHYTSLREVQEILKMWFLSYEILFLLERKQFQKLKYLIWV